MPLAGDLGEFAIGVLDGLWHAMQELATDPASEVGLGDGIVPSSEPTMLLDGRSAAW